MKFEDLPEADKKAVARAIGGAKSRGRQRPKPSRAGQAAAEQDEGCPYRCMDCPATDPPFPSYRAWDQHRKATAGHHHGRLAVTPRP